MSNTIVREVKWYSKYAFAGIVEGICIGIGLAIGVGLWQIIFAGGDALLG